MGGDFSEEPMTDVPSTLPPDWLAFYLWACSAADEHSGGTETQLITPEGDSL